MIDKEVLEKVVIAQEEKSELVKALELVQKYIIIYPLCFNYMGSNLYELNILEKKPITNEIKTQSIRVRITKKEYEFLKRVLRKKKNRG